MLSEVTRFTDLLTNYFEVDDLQQVLIVIAVAVTHKLNWSEMLWLRIIGASGTGKTELLRTLTFEPYSVKLENFTAGSIRRGFIRKKDANTQPKLLDYLNGKLVITKEFGSMLTKSGDNQREIFGLLRSVYDGELTTDYGSEEGHLEQTTHFDWILGATPLIDSNRAIEYSLGSRFIDLRWSTPTDRIGAVKKAQYNDGGLEIIRAKLSRAMADIIDSAVEVPKVELPYIATLADCASTMRSPVPRSSHTREIIEMPVTELGTRMGQALARIARGLVMIGVDEAELKPFLVRLVMNSITEIRVRIIKEWAKGVTEQREIAANVGLSQGSVSRVSEDIRLVGWKPEWLEMLNGVIK